MSLHTLAKAGALMVLAASCTPKAPSTPTNMPAEAATQPTDHCSPLPNEGDACPPTAGFCVESWGEPGGHSSALWCRDGHWEREEEVNLP